MPACLHRGLTKLLGCLLLQDEQQPPPDDATKGIEMEADFEGQLQDIQADPDADSDEEPGSDAEERLDQVSIYHVCPSKRPQCTQAVDQVATVSSKSRG